jgi:hypothetical protein
MIILRFLWWKILAALANAKTGEPLPGVDTVAIQQGRAATLTPVYDRLRRLRAVVSAYCRKAEMWHLLCQTAQT